MTPILNIPIAINTEESFLIDYYPHSSTPQGVIILLHGGGWISGNKDEMGYFAKQLHAKGYHVINLGYRLAPKTQHPKQLDDITQTIHWVKQQLGEDIPIHLLGYSAGGHLSLLWSYLHPTQVNRVISIAGVINMEDPKMAEQFTPLFRQYLGNFPIQDASPISILNHSKTPPPTLLIHAKDDDYVPFEQTQQLKDALSNNPKVGMLLEILPIEQGGHFFLYKKPAADDIIEATDRFIQSSL